MSVGAYHPYGVIVMKKKTYFTYILSVAVAEGVGLLAAWLTRAGIADYGSMTKPPLSPPAILFPAVWTVLYALMGVGAARIYLAQTSEARSNGLLLYAVQLAFNFFWSILFFNFQAFGFAFIWLLLLWGLILGMILFFRKTDPLAARLQLPYLIWVTFAAYLNLAVWLIR